MKLLVVSILVLVGAVVSASDSGCGLGSVIIQKNSKGLQLLSWTTNGVLFTQPLGITSGTSGCSSSGLVQNDRQIEYFVEVNHDDLGREMAQGSGDNLKTLAALSGCVSPQSQKVFAVFTQRSYDKIMRTAEVTASEIIKNLQIEMRQSEEVAKVCEMRKVSSL